MDKPAEVITVSAERPIAAPAEQVWAMVADVTRMGEWSPENERGEWIGGATGPAVGAKFKGYNRNSKKTWTTVNVVTEAEPGTVFAFETNAVGLAVARWEYRFEPTDDGCRVTESWTDRRGRFIRVVGGWASGVDDRAQHNRAGMERTLEALAAAAQGAA